MAKDYSKRSEEEAKTFELLDGFLEVKANWSPSTALAARVFRVMYYAMIDIDQINRIGAALNNVETVDLTEAVKALHQAKVLRSLGRDGRRYYEVNY